VVNRLTRELSLLRQQSASVVSTASSTSTGLLDPTDHNGNHLLSGASHPTPSRRHRSSSSLSTRSLTGSTPLAASSGTGGNTLSTTAGLAASTVSGIAPARDSATATPHASQPRESMSRHNSVASSRRSGASSPAFGYRHSSTSQQPISPGNARSPSLNSGAAAARYEETTQHRAELEAVKRENESLKRRIRELERSLNSRRTSSSNVSRERSESSTGANAGEQRDDNERAVKVD